MDHLFRDRPLVLPAVHGAMCHDRGMAIMKRSTAAAVVLAALALTACDMTGVPQVEGTYRGTLVWRLGGSEIMGTSTLTVVQSGDQVTVSGSWTVLGLTVDLPAFTGTINRTGNVTGQQSGLTAAPYSTPECGLFTPVSGDLTFNGRTARLSGITNTERCGVMQITATMTRQ